MTGHSSYKIHISRYTLYFPYHYWNVKWEARVSNCCERDSGSDLQMVLLLKFTTSQQCCNKPQNQPSSKNPACISSVTLPGMVDTHFHSLRDCHHLWVGIFHTAKCAFWKAASEDQWNLLYYLHCYMYCAITAASAYSHMPAMWYYTVEPPLTDIPATLLMWLLDAVPVEAPLI